ncbi:MAG: hypothetical protein HC913_24090 [Microscillaceae bacterium]|nr:hypothetical protein [Microscillaceae bacterium]
MLLLALCLGGAWLGKMPKMPPLPFLGEQIGGVHFVGPPQKTGIEAFQDIQAVSARWVSLVPYAFLPRDSLVLISKAARQWWGEKREGIAACVEMAKSLGLKTMIKPHLWLQGGKFTGVLDFETEAQWQAWEQHYAAYILGYAQLADSMQVEIFCLGTELDNFVQKRPQFWQNLIAQTRQLYKGKITYAANWDEYARVPFWAQLDYIGIDAYFPLSGERIPTPDSLEAGWRQHSPAMQALAQKHQKPILFTEFGYRSTEFTAREPWNSAQDHPAHTQAQVQALEALFAHFTPKKWFAGGFLWKWYARPRTERPSFATDYSPQQKPALETIKRWFERMKGRK